MKNLKLYLFLLMAKAGFKYASYEKIKHFLMPFKNPELVNFIALPIMFTKI
jgi:hypothetical protein